MANSNIDVRRDGDVPQKQLERREARNESRNEDWEPLRVMRALLSWDPFREMSPLGSYRGRSDEDQLVTAFDVKDTPTAFVFKADVPGMKEKDLDVQINGNRLTIRGQREAEHREPGHTYYTYERSYGSFARSFTLPDNANAQQCNAELNDGVLTVTIPKKATEQPRTVTVNQKPRSEKS